MKKNFLPVALEAVKKAGKVILHYFADDIRYKLKPDQTPVTLADLGAEKIIVATIKRHFPDHGFLGEETGDTKKTAEYTWIIDPIDGTKNYLRKIPIFATQLALMKKDEIILGVSNAPVLDELMHAEKGKGAYLNGKKIKVSETDLLENAYLSFGNIRYFEEIHNVPQLLLLTNNIRYSRSLGDFWSYHLLAQGKIDIAVEAKVKIWDIAAVTLIVKEAGGIVSDIAGNNINRHSTSIIATNKPLYQKVLKYFY